MTLNIAAFGSAQKFADIFSLYFACFIALTTRSDKTLIREPVSRGRRIASEIYCMYRFMLSAVCKRKLKSVSEVQ